MSDTKSKKYSVTGVGFDNVAYSFDKATGQMNGVFEVRANGGLKPIQKTLTLADGSTKTNDVWTTLTTSDDAMRAWNVANNKGNSDNDIGDVSKITFANDDVIEQKFQTNLKSFNNSAAVATIDEYRSGRNIADRTEQGTYEDYSNFRGYNSSETKASQIFAYPLDIDTRQDHFKITRYKYVRADTNLSKPRRVEKFEGKKIVVAGDSMIGNEPMGSIILPMPKATDVNSVEWGKSELNASGLLAMGSATLADTIFSGNGVLPRTTQINLEQQKRQREAKENQKRGDSSTGGNLGVFQAATNQFNTTIASLITGQELDQDTFLARAGGHVLNPNAEMLFQGPTIRNFSFTFLMVARSQKEGAEIRNMIRFLKLGMAPKFRNTTFLANPDIFTLEYKRDKQHLKTVNRFSPGGLALNSLAVDYAPSGYWAAYRDSQPVALKMDMTFSELRPIYEGDQSDPELEGSVGY